MQISIVGVGYVGLVTGACLANLGHNVLCMDIDEKKIENLIKGEMPFFEPQLKEIIQDNILKNRLKFTINGKEAIDFGEVVFCCVGTPSREDGSANLDYIFSVAKMVKENADQSKVLVIRSTVPPGTAKKCQIIVGNKVKLASNPEFMKEGSAVYDFTHPDKTVIGAEDKNIIEIVRKVYTGLERTYLSFIETDTATAEMIKYANNAFLATKISYINEIANICDIVGADVKDISRALGMDYRINPKFLNSGIGYGGSCFKKDVRALVNFAKIGGLKARLLEEVDESNEKQKIIFLKKIKEKFGEDLSHCIFTIWGLSFKPKTSDIREAPSLAIISKLLEFGAKVNVYDPVAAQEVKSIFGEKITYSNNVLESVKNSSAILLVTEWDEFRNLNLRQLGENMNKKIIFDGRNVYTPSIVKEQGFEYFGIGRKL